MKTELRSALINSRIVRNPAGMDAGKLESMRLLAELIMDEIEESLGIAEQTAIEWVMESERASDGTDTLLVIANSTCIFAIGYDATLRRVYLGDACVSTGEATIRDVTAAAVEMLRP